ncbi:hypothetical protein AVEN_156455-1 [Araneus ventricosus]|uniref:Uncharacterized protein n=1 Tax=Araneus ventricosus TaxID=182803 RepID=A0A4Y2SVT4_ARAVE|nr:hypothetical protein AVEN_137168-1 [Araneus ventricosus]GBN91766.1 hypothetical protein AVEN_156455-1 [Araneus ventricosus]
MSLSCLASLIVGEGVLQGLPDQPNIDLAKDLHDDQVNFDVVFPIHPNLPSQALEFSEEATLEGPMHVLLDSGKVSMLATTYAQCPVLKANLAPDKLSDIESCH